MMTNVSCLAASLRSTAIHLITITITTLLIAPASSVFGQVAGTGNTIPTLDPGPRDDSATTLANSVLKNFGLASNTRVIAATASGAISTQGGSQSEFRWQTSLAGYSYDDGTTVVSYSGGKMSLRSGGKVIPGPVDPEAAHAGFPAYLAATILAQRLGNARYSLVSKESESISGEEFFKIESALPGSTTAARLSKQTWWIDEQTFLPRAVDYYLPDTHDADITIPFRVMLDDYRFSNGILVPFRIENWYLDTQLDTVQINNVDLSIAGTNDGVQQ